jgi:hypothetical protein
MKSVIFKILTIKALYNQAKLDTSFINKAKSMEKIKIYKLFSYNFSCVGAPEVELYQKVEPIQNSKDHSVIPYWL